MRETFEGDEYRVQLRAFDKDEQIAGREAFQVTVLPVTANPFTSFSNGEIVFSGNEFGVAWGIVRAWTDRPHLYMPKCWKKYGNKK